MDRALAGIEVLEIELEILDVVEALASGPVAPMRNTAPSRPPKKDAQMPIHIARPGSPLRAIGWPSNVVAIDEGVPGSPSRTAVTSPPAEPPTYTPVMAASPCSGSRPKVNGNTTMMVIVIVTPGSAPPTIPASVPRNSGSRYFACRMLTTPAASSSYTARNRSSVRAA